LLDEEARDEYIEDVAEEYEDIREDHYDNLKERKYLTLAQARDRATPIDWLDFQVSSKYHKEYCPFLIQAPRPSFIGNRAYRNMPLSELIPFIDWKCFFDVWQLRGKYPNGRYPKIFLDETVGKYFSDGTAPVKDWI